MRHPRRPPRFTAEARQADLAVVDLIRRVAEARGATPAQVALAWLLAKKPWIAPIPGTRADRAAGGEHRRGRPVPHRLRRRELDEASARIRVVGERYPEAMQRMIDR